MTSSPTGKLKAATPAVRIARARSMVAQIEVNISQALRRAEMSLSCMSGGLGGLNVIIMRAGNRYLSRERGGRPRPPDGKPGMGRYIVGKLKPSIRKSSKRGELALYGAASVKRRRRDSSRIRAWHGRSNLGGGAK